MKKGLIFGLGALTGAGIGTGITIIVVSRRINRKKDDETEEVRAYYREKCKKCEYKKVENVDISGKNESEEQVETAEKDNKLAQKVGLAERNTADVGRINIVPSNIDYTKFAKMSQKYATGSTRELFSYPHEIDEVEFDSDDGGKRVILTYYESDDILADVNDRQSEYTVEDFGYENMNDFGFEGIKYLKNEKTNTKFKIIYEGNLTYDEATGGVNLNDP